MHWLNIFWFSFRYCAAFFIAVVSFVSSFECHCLWCQLTNGENMHIFCCISGVLGSRSDTKTQWEIYGSIVCARTRESNCRWIYSIETIMHFHVSMNFYVAAKNFNLKFHARIRRMLWKYHRILPMHTWKWCEGFFLISNKPNGDSTDSIVSRMALNPPTDPCVSVYLLSCIAVDIRFSMLVYITHLSHSLLLFLSRIHSSKQPF